jgi:phage terminase small subunit
MPTPARHANSTPAIRAQRFVSAIIKGMGPADACVHAGYKVKSRQVARASGSRLLARADVQARLTALREKASNESVLTLSRSAST